VTRSNLGSQDKRKVSRFIVLLGCRITYSGTSYSAVMVDVSLGGALLSSQFMPPVGSDIIVTLQPPILERELKLNGRVVRGNWVESAAGKLGRFGIRFTNTPLDLVRLITKLSSPQYKP
jgi:hypothetical protein